MDFISQISSYIINLTWWELITACGEILLIYWIIYGAIYILRGMKAGYIFLGVIFLLLSLTVLTAVFDLRVVGFFLTQFWSLLGIGLIVLFQPEMRRFFAYLGQVRLRFGTRLIDNEFYHEIARAVRHMSERRIGALVVFENKLAVQAVTAQGGVQLDCKITAPLVESIFYPNSPLHDGAILVQNGRITAAHMILPLSRNESVIARKLGTRHRAALGISEETDALALIVSEETGRISVACRGELILDVDPRTLVQLLLNLQMRPWVARHDVNRMSETQQNLAEQAGEAVRKEIRKEVES